MLTESLKTSQDSEYIHVAFCSWEKIYECIENNGLLNVPFMRLCSLIGVNAGYGPIILNIILHFLTTFTIIFVQIKKYKISYHALFLRRRRKKKM